MKLSTPHWHDLFHHGSFSGWDVYDETGIHRGWLAAVGIFFLLLGLFGVGAAALMTIASVMFFGVLALLGGVVQLAQSLTSHGQRNVVAGALLGGLYIFAGLVVLYNPVASSMVLTLLLACALVALGVVRIFFSMEHRSSRYWIWSAVSGAVSILLGILILAQWPVTGLWVIGLFISLEMIFHGAAALGLAMKRGMLA